MILQLGIVVKPSVAAKWQTRQTPRCFIGATCLTGEVTLVIDPSLKFQKFMGFGTSFTELSGLHLGRGNEFCTKKFTET